MEAFDEYQQQEAWTWEHQALVRARLIYGDAQLQQGFSQVRQQTLMQEREETALRQQVIEMRHKMREHLGSKKAGLFDLKQDEGGITDIEFIAQYLVLQHASENPALAYWSDNVRIFDTMAEYDQMSPEQVTTIKSAYCAMRDAIHRLNLLGQSAYVDEQQFSAERAIVRQVWQQYLAKHYESDTLAE